MAVSAFGQLSVRNQGGSITINDATASGPSKATPYPSTNLVQGTIGALEKVTVTLSGVTHGFPDDIDMILQSPDGQVTMLMSDAGGQFDLFNTSFTLDSTAPLALPDEGQIGDGFTYKPANYDSGDPDTFAAGSSPGGPSLSAGSATGLAGNLSSFITKPAANVNGTWNLYVMDDTTVDGGSLQSWTLNLYMTPSLLITNSSPVTTAEDTPATINVFVNDSDTPLSGVTLTAKSSDQNIIKDSGLTFGGNSGGTNRTLTITPVANASGGPVTITVTATDPQTGTTLIPGVNQLTFQVNVTPVNDAPVLTLGTSSTTIPQGGISTNIFIKLTDVDTTPQDDPRNAVLTATSSNPNIIPATNVLFTRIETGGTLGTNRVVQIAAGSAIGSSTITIIATDAFGAASSNSINVTVTGTSSFVGSNPTKITVPGGPAGGAGTPYPSIITVPSSVGPGLVGKVTVSLINIESVSPAELGVLLVSPDGRAGVLMRGAGDTVPVGYGDTNDVRVTFDRDATTTISGAALTTSTNRTADFSAGDFPAPAPAQPYTTDIDAFRGAQATGNWSLYVYDVGFQNLLPVQIAGGWTLQISSAPTIGAIGNQTIPEDTSRTLTFFVGDFEGNVTNLTAHTVNPADAANISLVTSLSGNTGTLTITPVTNFNTGVPAVPIPIAVVAQDNSGGFTGTNIFNLTVTPVNDAPTVSAIHDQIVRAGQSVGPVPFTVGDVETAPGSLIVNATSDNPKLLPPGAIVLGGSGANRTITFFPATAQGGTATITLTVQDTGDGLNPPLTTTTTFGLIVQEASNPLFENGTGIVLNDNAVASPYPSIINVSGLVGTIAEVQVTLYGITHPNPDDIDAMLVGPGTTPVALIFMSDAGDNAPLNSVTLRFRQSAGAQLPDEAQIVSGDYLPSNFDVLNDFPVNGSPAPNAASFDSFVGGNPNGDWKLYIYDDTPSTRGGVISSWQLSIRTRPSLAAIPDQVVAEHNSLRVTANLGDNQPGVPYIVNTSVAALPGSSVVISSITPTNGSTVFGSSQTLTINLIPEIGSNNQTNQVTVTFTDPNGFSVTRTFNVIVTPVNDVPVFGAIATPKSTPAATPISFTFDVSDPEGTAVKVVASSSDQNVVRDADIAISPGTSTATTRTITITPNGTTTGPTTITLTATDNGGTGLSTTKQFVLNVTPTVAFDNRGTPIIINDFAPATPYPSTINVSGVNGTVSGASVVLLGFTHPFPDDVDVLLVSPDGRAVMLMSDAGGGSAVNGARLTFAMGNPLIPDSSPITTGTYSPANYAGGDADEMPGPAPAAPFGGYSTDLNSFAGVNPNGTWSLYVRDDTFPQGGSISGGWILLLKTAPTITQVATQTTLEDTLLNVPVQVSDQDTGVSGLTLTVTKDETLAPGLIQSISFVTNSASPPNVNYTLSILPATNRPAGLTTPETNSITVSVSDGTSSASTTFLVRVLPVNDAPQVAGAFSPTSATTATNHVVTAQTTTSPAVSHPITIRFKVTDVDSRLGTSTNVVVQSLNPTLLPNNTANITVAGPNDQAPGTTFNVDVTLTPAVNQSGSAVVNFIVHDENSTVTNVVTLEVTPANNAPTIAFPTMGNPPRTNVIAGGTISGIPVTVNDVETPAGNIVVTATSSDQLLIPNGNISTGGRGNDRTINLTTVGTVGAATDVTISVVADDTTGAKSTNTFVVTITPPPGTLGVNTAPISIPATGTAGPASLYPSTIQFNGLIGSVSKVTVTLDGLTHTAPDDLDILLVSPSGKAVMVMSDAGGHSAISNARLVFDQGSNNVLPDEGLLVSGTYRPADYEPGSDTFPSPAPAGPYTADLGAFNGLNPNGTWSLYIVDDATGDVGSLQFGWALRIETGPTITLNSGLNQPGGTPTFIQFNEDTTAPFQFTINDMVTPPGSLEVSFNESNPSLIDSIVTNWVSVSGNAATINAIIQPVTNGFGTNNLTIVVRRSDGAQSSLVIPMNIVPNNDLPTISRLVDISTPSDTSIDVPILITDVDTPLNRIWITGTSGNQAIISNTNILIIGRTNVQKGVVANSTSLSAFPRGNADSWTNFIRIVPNTAVSGGPVPITITVKEVDANGADVPGQSVSSTFNVTVTPVNHRPSFTGTALPTIIAVEAGKSTTNIQFAVSDPDPGDLLKITATSSDTNLVRDADIVIFASDGTTVLPNGTLAAPGTRFVRVTTQRGVQGDATINLVLQDNGNPVGSATASFIVRVVPTRELVFSNRNPITINDNSTATPYPSTINVSGFAGNVSKVTVSLNGFWHTFPGDVDMILVSPTGKKSYLMSDAGNGSPIPSSAAINISFDDTDPNAILMPATGALTSRTYRVTNYEGQTDTFPSPAPAGPYAEALSTFNGESPNGVWSLYIVDDFPPDSGAITNGWSIGITTLPAISGLADVVSPEDVSVRQSFSIAEESFINSSNFTFSVSSSNPALVPSSTNNIQIAGTGTNRTVTVIPAPNANTNNAGGPATITITEQTSGVSTSFKATFTPVNDAPQLGIGSNFAAVPNQGISPGSFVIITNFNISDVETPRKDLQVTVSSSNPSVIPAANVVISGTDLRIFSGTQSGTSTITITATDTGDGINPPATGSISFDVTVVAGQNPVFTSSGGVTINDNSNATPYPLTVTVSNVNGTVRDLTVTLTGLTHAFPDDVDILLVGPNGQGVVVMSDAGGGGTGTPNALSNAWLTFNDSASQSLPDSSPIQPFTVYKPTNYEISNSEFPAPAPVGPYQATFGGAFSGINPNGTWSLYVRDDASPDAGSLGGLILNFALNEVGPIISGLTNQVNGTEDQLVEVPFSFASASNPADVTFTATASDSSIVSAIKVTGTDTNRVLEITLVPDASGTNTITVVGTDATGSRTRQFVLNVQPVNDAPTLGPIADQSVDASSGPVDVRLTVNDVDTPVAQLNFTYTTSSVGIVQNVTFTKSGTNVTMTITPVAGASGTDRITVSVNDGEFTARQSFNFTVRPPASAPVIGTIPNLVLNGGTPATVPLNITDADTPLSQLSLFSPSGAFASASFNFVSNVWVMTVTPVAGANGTETLLVQVNDGQFVVRTNFQVTVISYAPPVLAVIPNQTMANTNSLVVPLSVTPGTVPLSQLSINASFVGTVIQSATVTKTSSNAFVTLVAKPNATGTERITVSVNDGQNVVRQSFDVTVSGPYVAPIIAAISNQTTPNTASLQVPLNITPGSVALSDLNINASFIGTVIQSATVTKTSSNAFVTILPKTGASGTEQVTIAVNDGQTVVRQSFNVTVTTGGGGDAATLAIARNGTNVVITLTGTPGATYTVQGATDVTGPWSVVGTVTLDNAGTGQLTVPITGARRFFRAHTGGAVIPTGALITNVVETGGDNEATDTVTAKWTGQTYISGILNEPIRPKGTNDPYTVGFFVEDAPAYVDRAHQWNGISTNMPLPAYLVGGEYIMSGNDNRDNTNYNLAITLSRPATVYLLVDNRLGDANPTNPPAGGLPPAQWTNMTWLGSMGFTPVMTGLNRTTNSTIPDEVGIDGDGTLGVGPGNEIQDYSSVYSKQFPAGTFHLFQADNAGQNMYGVVVKPLLVDVARPGDPVVRVDGTNVVAAGGESPAAESVDHVIDGVSQKYLNFTKQGSGFIVTPSMGGTIVSGLKLWTANDSVGRDPASYRFEGSTTGATGPFTKISEGALNLPAGRNGTGNTPLTGSTNQAVYFTNSIPYTSYRVTFPTIKDPTANSMQIAEVELLGQAPQ